jgi:elongation factor 1-beta
MGTVAIKLKIMPSSPNENLEDIKKKVEKKIIFMKGKVNNAEYEPIAFGLKAVIITIAWPEEQDTEPLESAFSDIKEINSAQIIDYRRAFG